MRTSAYPINKLFTDRWSPRAMSGEQIDDRDLMTLFEAARWAPSSYNAQPWRFIYAKRDTEHWQKLFDLLVPFNQSWCINAAALILMISRTRFEKTDKPASTHSFDTGSAWLSLALQGHMMGLVVHGMEGFDHEKARADLKIPELYQIDAMAAVGKLGKTEDLPEDLVEREKTRSDRKPLGEIVFEGVFVE